MFNRIFRNALAAFAAIGAVTTLAAIPTPASAYWVGPGYHYGYHVRVVVPSYNYGYNYGYNSGYAAPCIRYRPVTGYYGNVIGATAVNTCY